MCLALYLFTNSPLPESAWDKDEPKAYVQAATSESDRGALNWPHSQQYLYYIGSYEGCGCGWGAISEYDEPEEREASQNGRDDLCRGLRGADLTDAWLVACWEGDQGKPLKPGRAITLEEIGDATFEFEELQKYTFNFGDRH